MGSVTEIAGRLAVLIVLSLPGCGEPDIFVCSDDSSCPDGRCESNGFCSFPSDECSSGWTYGSLSGPYSGQCVAPEDSGSTGTTTPEMTSSSSSTSSASSTLGSDASSTSEMPDACGTGEACLVVPDGWNGPVQLGDAEDDCEREVFQGASSYEGEWSCACACETTETSDCTDTPVTLELFDGDDCSGVPTWTETLSQSCQDFSYIDFYRVRAASDVPVSCTATASVEGNEILAIGSQLGCGVPQGSACEGGTCQSAEAPACVFAEGDLPCPDGFAERSVLFRDFDDGRACSACGCEATASCEGQFVLHTDLSGCSQASSLFFPFGTCSGSTSLVRGARIIEQDAEPTIQCGTNGGAPMGGIEPTQPTTVCCSG